MLTRDFFLVLSLSMSLACREEGRTSKALPAFSPKGEREKYNQDGGRQGAADPKLLHLSRACWALLQLGMDA